MPGLEIIFQPLPDLPINQEWQIDRRYRIQHFLYVLYDFLDQHTEFHKDGDDEWHQMLRMVDIAFSLWRSAFLTNVAGARSVIYSHMKDFVQKVVETNTITFADDHKMCELTVSYYNNNARYRLERMYEFAPDLLELGSVKRVADLRKQPDIATMEQTKLWDMYYDALRDCFDQFIQHWNANVRPQRKPIPVPPKIAPSTASVAAASTSADGSSESPPL